MTVTGELLIFLVGQGGGGGRANKPPAILGRVGDGDAKGKRHNKHVDSTLIPILQRLLQDSDAEVTMALLRAVNNALRSGTARETASVHFAPSSHHGAVPEGVDDDSC